MPSAEILQRDGQPLARAGEFKFIIELKIDEVVSFLQWLTDQLIERFVAVGIFHYAIRDFSSERSFKGPMVYMANAEQAIHLRMACQFPCDQLVVSELGVL